MVNLITHNEVQKKKRLRTCTILRSFWTSDNVCTYKYIVYIMRYIYIYIYIALITTPRLSTEACYVFNFFSFIYHHCYIPARMIIIRDLTGCHRKTTMYDIDFFFLFLIYKIN